MSRPAGREAQRLSVEVDAGLIAPALGLNVPTFRRLMAEQRIPVLCERGTGSDAGRVRGTFYYGGRRVRVVVDEFGKPVGQPVTDTGRSPP